MVRIKYLCSLDNKRCLSEISEAFGEKVIDNKYVFLPERIGHGYNYAIDVMPGVSALLVKVALKEQFEVVRYSTEEDLFILHYDLGDEVTLSIIENKPQEIGYKVNLGFSLMDTSVSSGLVVPGNSNSYAMRILVSKDFIYKNMGGAFLSEKNKKHYFHDHIDSDSLLMLESLKEREVFDDSFEFYFRGVALELLANFIKRYSGKVIKPYKILQTELHSIELTKRFLLDNLYEPFPGVPFLAEMAGMSESKYKSLFKNFYQITPQKFFVREKILVAGKLLTTGAFDSISEVVRKLNYSSFMRFSQHYLSVSGNKPSEDFIRKNY